MPDGTDDEWVEVHNPMDRGILVEIDGKAVGLKPDQTLRVKRSDHDGPSELEGALRELIAEQHGVGEDEIELETKSGRDGEPATLEARWEEDT